MAMKPEYLIPLIAYLLGSIPSGYLIVKLKTGGDIRKTGSGNIGATNVFRKSKASGLLTLALDGAKGWLAVMISVWMGAGLEWQAAAAVLAIAGHMFTVWLRFKGGKGVATGCGAYLALAPAAVGAALAVFVLACVLTRFVSLSSILASAAFPLCAWLLGSPPAVVAGGAVGSALIVAKHHENIRRLLSGTENRFSLGGRS